MEGPPHLAGVADTAGQVGTANFVNPNAPAEIVEGIEKYLEKNEINSVGKLIGALKLG